MEVDVETVARDFHVALAQSPAHDTLKGTIASLMMFCNDLHVVARARMVDEQLSSRSIRNPRVLAAMRKVPRHLFVPNMLVNDAYADRPLSIGLGQTISQPYIVALMAELLRISPNARVLEIGTGSGYSAAVLAELAQDVVTLERHDELATRARLILADLAITNAHVYVTDGTLGWPSAAPYNAICVTASGPIIPAELLDQLALGGLLVIPIGEDAASQQLALVERTGPDSFVQTMICPVRFVPLIGARGWRDDGGLSR